MSPGLPNANNQKQKNRGSVFLSTVVTFWTNGILQAPLIPMITDGNPWWDIETRCRQINPQLHLSPAKDAPKKTVSFISLFYRAQFLVFFCVFTFPVSPFFESHQMFQNMTVWKFDNFGQSAGCVKAESLHATWRKLKKVPFSNICPSIEIP